MARNLAETSYVTTERNKFLSTGHVIYVYVRDAINENAFLPDGGGDLHQQISQCCPC